MGDSFSTSLFKQSFIHVFDTDEQGALKLGYNAKIEIKVLPGMPIFVVCVHNTVLFHECSFYYLLNVSSGYKRTKSKWCYWLLCIGRCKI